MRLQIATPADLETTRMTVKLVPLKPTPNAGEVVLTDPVTILGRGRRCAVCVLDPMVSRRHCKLTLDGGRLTVRDLGSANGTYVNLTRVHETELKDGDVLIIGRHTFTVRIESAAVKAAGSADRSDRPREPAPAGVEELGEPGPSAGADPTDVLFHEAAPVPEEIAPDAAASADGSQTAGGASDAEDLAEDAAQAALLAALADMADRDADAEPDPAGPAEEARAPADPDGPLEQLLEDRDDIYEEPPDDEAADVDDEIAALAAELALVQQETQQELSQLAEGPTVLDRQAEETPEPFAAAETSAASAVAPEAEQQAEPAAPLSEAPVAADAQGEPAGAVADAQGEAPAPPDEALDEAAVAERPEEPAFPDAEDLPDGRPALRPIFETDEDEERAAFAAAAPEQPVEGNPALAPSHGLARRSGEVATIDVLGELADESRQAAPPSPWAEPAADADGDGEDESSSVDLLSQVADRRVEAAPEPAAAWDEPGLEAAGLIAPEDTLAKLAEGPAVDVLSEVPAHPVEAEPTGQAAAPAEELEAEPLEAEPPAAEAAPGEGEVALETAPEPPAAVVEPPAAPPAEEAQAQTVEAPAEALPGEYPEESPAEESAEAWAPAGEETPSAVLEPADSQAADVEPLVEAVEPPTAEEAQPAAEEAPPAAASAPEAEVAEEPPWPAADTEPALEPVEPPAEEAPPAPEPVAVPIEPCTSLHPAEDAESRADRPLHEGARSGERGIVSLFLSKGADVNAPAGRHGATALHYAAGNGHIMIVEFLVARGANVNALDDLGATPLYWAKLLGQEEVVTFLLDRGADPNAIEGVEPL